MTKLTDEEREIWKDAYALHEKYHDCTPESDREWQKFLGEINDFADKHDWKNSDLARLMFGMLLDLFNEKAKVAQVAREELPNQMTIDELFGEGF